MNAPLYIVGAGGIGCALGYALAAARPILVDANPEKVERGNQHGLVLDDRPPARLVFASFNNWAPEPESTILLCTKCYDNAAALTRVPEQAVLIPIQNGFDPDLQPEVEGIASFVSECRPDRPETRITRGGALHLGHRGSPSPNAIKRLNQIAD